MSWRRRTGGCAVALLLSVSLVAPAGAATNREDRTAGGIQAVWQNLETLWLVAQSWWLGGIESATSAVTETSVDPAGEPIPTGTDPDPGARGGAGSCNGTTGGGGETDGGSYDPNGG